MRPPISAVRRNGPLRLTAMTLSNSSSPTSTRLGYSGAMPALLTRMSTLPNSACDGGVEGVEIGPLPDVAGDRQRRPTRLLAHLLGERRAGVELAAGDGDVGAAAGEGQHHLPSEAPAAAGDEGDLAGQVDLHRCPFASVSASRGCARRGGRACRCGRRGWPSARRCSRPGRSAGAAVGGSRTSANTRTPRTRRRRRRRSRSGAA